MQIVSFSIEHMCHCDILLGTDFSQSGDNQVYSHDINSNSSARFLSFHLGTPIFNLSVNS